MFGAYVRVSSEEQKKYGHGADAQVHAIKQYCTYNGINIDEMNWYIDNGHTGSNENRPEFIRLNEDIKNGKISTLIVTTTERISRKIVFREQYFNNLLEMGIEVRAINELFDWNTAYGRQQNRSKAVYDQAESELASERTKKALDQSARNGNYIKPRVPRGYLRVAPLTPKDKKITVDPETLEFYRTLFEDIASEKYNPTTLARKLNNENALNLYWNERYLRNMLRDPIYKGDFEGVRVYIENHSPAIVSKELWEETQLILNKRTRKNTHQYLFSGIAKCSKCKSFLVNESTYKKKTGTRYFYYLCPNCKKRIQEKKLEDNMLLLSMTYLFEDNLEEISQEVEAELKRIDYLTNSYNDDFICGRLSNAEWLRLKNDMLLRKLELEHERLSSIETERARWLNLSYRRKIQLLKSNNLKAVVDFNSQEITIILETNGKLLTLTKRIE